MNPAEREELARLLPSPGDPVLQSDRLRQLENRLMQEITREAIPQATPAVVPEQLPARRNTRARIALPIGIAAAVSALFLAAGAGSEPERPAFDDEAVGLLTRIATVAAAKNTPSVRDDQYIYTRTQGMQQIAGEGEDNFQRSDWHAVNGKRDGLARITVLSGPSGKGSMDMKLAADPNATSYRELQEMPTDPDKMYNTVWEATQGQGPTHEAAALEQIGTMLQGATLLPEVDAALYRAAAMIPGVSVIDSAKDAAGRPGVGLAFGIGDDRDVWVFDKKSLTYLGSDDVALLQVGVVDHLGQALNR
ncbi:CU044_5270 family protein [Streptomyces sp. NPDC048171]|uniref:CU044_5270 family protein n=1 Tax=Streptomyces sp. NPDC048171 TaxID=3365504 RepID=UPI0037225A41